MSLSVHKLGLALLRRIGITSFDPAANATNQNRRGLCDGDLDETLIAINGAMQECFALGPIELSEQRQSAVLHAATGVTLDVTAQSTTIANLATWAAWMQGCTIRIPGDARDNELISATQLLRPFMGTTAAGVPATVYGNAVPLAGTVLSVLEPVEIPGVCPLREGVCVTTALTEPIGQPSHWAVETRHIAANAFTQRILRLWPMPGRAYALTYKAQVKPPVYTPADFYSGTSYGVDPGTVIPFDWVESTLLPEALRRFCTHPAFDGNIEMIRLEAEGAKRIFAESAKPKKAAQKAKYRWRV